MDKLNCLDKHTDWVTVDSFNLDAEIPDSVQSIYCDTRDFALTWNDKLPGIDKNAHMNSEVNNNDGLNEFFNLIRLNNRENYVIDKKDILTWLDDLCKKTGGYDAKWRCIESKVKHCSNWTLKYIRFLRNPNNPNEFIVCNRHMFPVHYKEIKDTIEGELLNAY